MRQAGISAGSNERLWRKGACSRIALDARRQVAPLAAAHAHADALLRVMSEPPCALNGMQLQWTRTSNVDPSERGRMVCSMRLAGGSDCYGKGIGAARRKIGDKDPVFELEGCDVRRCRK